MTFYFFTVAQQVMVLFLLMLLGIIANRFKWLNENSVAGMTKIALYLVTPCVIINSFCREMEEELLEGLVVTAIISVAIYTGAILLAHLFIKDKDEGKERIFRFAAVFGNCGFMGLPLQQAILGDEGVFYGAVYVAVFNIIVWTYGVFEISGKKEEFSVKKLILNPGVLGTLIGFTIFLFQIKLPFIVDTSIAHMAALNAPLPMIIIGYYIGNLTIRSFTTNKKQYIPAFLRLVAIPLISIFVMNLFNVDPLIMVACTIATATPVAANTAMFATFYKRDAELSAGLVSITTLISIVTIPILVSLAQAMAN
ncbi:MAG: AEC family transporter [Ruminococcaceae bacterium]|nr:AEC family transporter [Oscillospiraceae bacterium]